MIINILQYSKYSLVNAPLLINASILFQKNGESQFDYKILIIVHAIHCYSTCNATNNKSVKSLLRGDFYYGIFGKCFLPVNLLLIEICALKSFLIYFNGKSGACLYDSTCILLLFTFSYFALNCGVGALCYLCMYLVNVGIQ